MPTNQRTSLLLQVAEMVRDLQEEPTPEINVVLKELSDSALQFVPGAKYASVTVLGPTGSIETPSATHRYAIVLDDIQRRRKEGPCLSAAWDHDIVRIDDLAADHRWPLYRGDALEQTTVRSILSLRLFTDSMSRGALNFYADSTGVFDDESVQLGLIFATHAALAWKIVQRGEQFKSALASRDIIGQAKGMIMERFNVDAVQAFDLLKRLSQSSNASVTDIAQRLVRADHPHR